MTFFFLSLFIILVFLRPQEWLLVWLWGWPLLDVVFLLAMVGFAIEWHEGRLRFPKECPQIYLLLGLWFACAMSHIAHTFFAGLIQTAPLAFKLIFFTMVLIVVLDRPSRLRKMTIVFVAMACVIALHVLLQANLGYGFAWAPPLWVGPSGGKPGYYRTYFFGIFSDPNDVAQILATAIPLAFSIPKRRSFFGFLLGCAIAAFLIAGIQTTHSRGGLVALAAAGGMMAGLFLPARWQRWHLLLIVLGFLVMCPASGKLQDESAHDRVVFWGQANRIFKKNPIFGIGLNMITDYIEADRTVHNAFVLAYTEIGLFGYWFWFGLLQMGLVGAWRGRMRVRRPLNREQEWLRRFSGLTVAAATAYAASAYFLTRAFVYPFFFLLAMLAAIPVVVRRSLGPGAPRMFNLHRDIFIGCTVGMLLSVAYIYVSILLLNKAYYNF